ncbi:hypothetical protein EIL87_11980 [Saccharopolyspora rhizosphaerae]|uniref:Uncharacterized protein n=1 Tax=Saccharopolyspora rhizosphaerae TaxID=2492662 RepID=A0A3R8P0Q2_9PSEU|nr:hypothetical protein [Saccharopolyspora rhizosphaerae]RRO16992.1 hypothetical protein EIL87_11980 [Saccharopolyspora rhizosphaerae]
MPTDTAPSRTQSACRAAFVTTLLVFLALAAVLVTTQVAGVVLLQPTWITWASETLLTPSITAGVVFGLVAFISGYLVPERATAEG